MDKYQSWTLSTAVYPEAGQGTERELNYLVHGLTGEAGELANKFKKILRSSKMTLDIQNKVVLKQEEQLNLIYELGDVLWYLARICTVLEINLDTLALYNQAKLIARKKEGQIKEHT